MLRKPQFTLQTPAAQDHCNEQALQQRRQMGAPVAPVGERGQVMGRMLGENKGLIGPAQKGLQIAKSGVDPLKLQQISRLGATDHGGPARAVPRRGRAEAGQTVGVHGAVRRQVLARAVPQGSEGDTRNGDELRHRISD